MRIVTAACLAGVATYLVKPAFAGSHAFVSLVACSAVYGAVCLIAIFLIGAITPEEKSEIREALMKYIQPITRRLRTESAGIQACAPLPAERK
jgi:hypothetical protein